jgi:hypothetical protein
MLNFETTSYLIYNENLILSNAYQVMDQDRQKWDLPSQCEKVFQLDPKSFDLFFYSLEIGLPTFDEIFLL